MKVIKYPKREEWQDLLKRPGLDLSALYGTVQEIISKVILDGDTALKELTHKFDGLVLEELTVTREEMEEAALEIGEELKMAIGEAYKNIEKFHRAQIGNSPSVETTPGVRCWQKIVPVEKVGLYIPGGSAPLLSTVLMLGIPARLAGCKEIILCSPPGKDGKIHKAILYIASLLQIDKIFKIGGAQAIAAMAYGTATVPAVSKIFGPGNQFVTAAKVLVSRDKVAIDMPAGPSEVAVVADASAIPEFIASDLLSQAEHGADSQVLLFTTEEPLIEKVKAQLDHQLNDLPRKEIAAAALDNCRLFLLDTREEIVEMVNNYAPEHLIIACENYHDLADKIVNAGSVFLGNYTPESAGDYASGTNHTLPTNGWATVYSGVNMDSFVKKITFQEISKSGLVNLSKTVMRLAEEEELIAHRNAISIRIRKEED